MVSNGWPNGSIRAGRHPCQKVLERDRCPVSGLAQGGSAPGGVGQPAFRPIRPARVVASCRPASAAFEVVGEVVALEGMHVPVTMWQGTI